MHSIRAPPSGVRPDGRPIYSLPVLVDSARQGPISNPNLIAEYLESQYPARPVFPEGSRAVQSLFVHYVQEVFSKPLLAIMVPLTHQHLPGHLPYPPGTHALSGPQLKLAWKAVQDQFDFLAAILDKNSGDQHGDGLAVMGHELSYADFALCSVLVWIQRVAGHETWRMVRDWNGGRWRRLYERCREWMDDEL
jgi:glutathione S-transferase